MRLRSLGFPAPIRHSFLVARGLGLAVVLLGAPWVTTSALGFLGSSCKALCARVCFDLVCCLIVLGLFVLGGAPVLSTPCSLGTTPRKRGAAPGPRQVFGFVVRGNCTCLVFGLVRRGCLRFLLSVCTFGICRCLLPLCRFCSFMLFVCHETNQANRHVCIPPLPAPPWPFRLFFSLVPHCSVFFQFVLPRFAVCLFQLFGFCGSGFLVLIFHIYWDCSEAFLWTIHG